MMSDSCCSFYKTLLCLFILNLFLFPVMGFSGVVDEKLKGDEKLSASDLNKLGAKAKKSGNSLLAKRVSLAKTFAKMRKK